MSTENIDPIEINDVEESGTGTVARRGAVAAVAAGGAAAAYAVFGRSSGPSVAGSAAKNAPAGRPVPAAVPPRPMQADDLATAMVAASLEQLAVNTYGAALDAATSGALGDVPPAVAEYVTTARADHQAHLDAWNGVLTGAGQPAVNAPPADLEASVNSQFGMVTDVVGVAQLALMLEQVAADTYLGAIGTLQSPEAINLAGSIFPIDRQHISVLLFALGMYPVPEVFATSDMAFAGGGLAAPMMPPTG